MSDQNSEIFQDSTKRAALKDAQHPFALVLGCSDSRVAAEIIFDQGLGELFVVRTAGHVVDAGVLGSIEFGVEILGIPLVVVLGHDSCGAVKAAMDSVSTGDLPGGYIRDIVEHVLPSNVAIGAGDGQSTPERVGAEHVMQTARLLNDRSRIVNDAIDSGRLAIVGATYRLAEGNVHVEGTLGEV
ncbi:carbonic anhydrase [Cumulibacter manganitolerans]|uniref:carbonic anhydrase n=1 Tax=Cumulibacter manganitolerans TaxID=1884992 RepID=UPI001E60D2AC|nr:carbonic anhydrase [Cumulibacter manganitolerans]